MRGLVLGAAAALSLATGACSKKEEQVVQPIRDRGFSPPVVTIDDYGLLYREGIYKPVLDDDGITTHAEADTFLAQYLDGFRDKFHTQILGSSVIISDLGMCQGTGPDFNNSLVVTDFEPQANPLDQAGVMDELKFKQVSTARVCGDTSKLRHLEPLLPVANAGENKEVYEKLEYIKTLVLRGQKTSLEF